MNEPPVGFDRAIERSSGVCCAIGTEKIPTDPSLLQAVDEIAPDRTAGSCRRSSARCPRWVRPQRAGALLIAVRSIVVLARSARLRCGCRLDRRFDFVRVESSRKPSQATRRSPFASARGAEEIGVTEQGGGERGVSAGESEARGRGRQRVGCGSRRGRGGGGCFPPLQGMSRIDIEAWLRWRRASSVSELDEFLVDHEHRPRAAAQAQAARSPARRAAMRVQRVPTRRR